MPNGELAAALELLEAALADFRRAYEAWLAGASPENEDELRELLAAAERRLDEARQALTVVRERR